MDSLLWFHRLERIALVEVGLGMLASIGAAEQSYNVSLGMFLLYSAYSRTGKLNATSGLLHLLSFVCDIIILSVYGDTWAEQKHAHIFSLAVIIVNLFVKAVALLVIVLIYGQIGNNRHPLHYHTMPYTQPTIHPSYYPSNADETTGLNDTSIAAEEGVARYGEKAVAGGASGAYMESYQSDSFDR